MVATLFRKLQGLCKERCANFVFRKKEFFWGAKAKARNIRKHSTNVVRMENRLSAPHANFARFLQKGALAANARKHTHTCRLHYSSFWGVFWDLPGYGRFLGPKVLQNSGFSVFCLVALLARMASKDLTVAFFVLGLFLLLHKIPHITSPCPFLCMFWNLCFLCPFRKQQHCHAIS